MGFDTLLGHTDKISKHIAMCDKQMHQINHIECYKIKVTPFMLYWCHSAKFKSALL